MITRSEAEFVTALPMSTTGKFMHGKGRVFRIGHLGDFNDLSLVGTLSGVEMGLALAGVPHQAGGVSAALAYLAEAASEPSAVVRSVSERRS